MKALLVLVLLTGVAAAEPPDEVISTQPLALVGRGVSVAYERRIAERLSVAGVGGLRGAALEDYNSQTVTAGAELRIWVRERTPMLGPFVAWHASVGYTRLADDAMGYVGGTTSLSQRIDAGWRFAIRNIAITPTIGIGAREDIDHAGELATMVRPMFAIGLEVGWMR
jgi:hypothetical protein